LETAKGTVEPSLEEESSRLVLDWGRSGVDGSLPVRGEKLPGARGWARAGCMVLVGGFVRGLLHLGLFVCKIYGQPFAKNTGALPVLRRHQFEDTARLAV